MEQFLTLLKNTITLMRWQDIIDMLLVAYLVYKLFALLRDSSAAQVIRGIIVIVVVTQIVGWLQFNVLYYILSATLQIGILALVVLFQPELRRMLDSVGRSRIPSLFAPEREQERGGIAREIAQLVETTAFFSKTKTGTLIVLERETRLGDIVKTGTILNAELSSELLKNIFFKSAPLHDGAAVVRDGRVAAAGCILPISENKKLSRDLGTRHRAGVGLSEVSDALVIIVSEENGAISVASDGLLKRHLSPETLSAFLAKELIPPQEQEKKLDKLFFWRKSGKKGSGK